MRRSFQFRDVIATKYIKAKKIAEITTSPTMLDRGSLRSEKGTYTPKLKVTKLNLSRFLASAWLLALQDKWIQRSG